MPSLTLFRSTLRMPVTARLAPALSTRTFRSSGVSRMAYKDDQDRESLKPKAQEYSKSDTDDGAAANEDAAFNPDKTSPETEKDTAGQGGAAGNPLESSPANKEMAGGGGAAGEGSKPKPDNNNKSSGGGSPTKGKKA